MNDVLPIPDDAAIAALAPTGRLRAGINLSNFLLVTGRTDDGDPVGVAPDMSALLARQLGVEIDYVTYTTPSALADAATAGQWDTGCIGAEPARATHIDFTVAYCEIESTYLVPAGSPLMTIDDVDQPGVRIASAPGAAYDLWLAANLQDAELVHSETLGGSFDLFVDEGLDALAGLRPGLSNWLEKVPGARVVDGKFSSVQQAMGTPAGRDPAGATYLASFVDAANADGVVAGLIDTYGVTGKLTPA